MIEKILLNGKRFDYGSIEGYVNSTKLIPLRQKVMCIIKTG